MTEVTRRKIRPEAVWAEARRAWERGETARSVAARYDVGVPALWKRREAEGWKRPAPGAGPVEPAEGWDAWANRELDTFTERLEATRELAMDLVKVMQGGPISEAPLWHLSFLYDWRADNLGPEVAAGDRARAQTQAWGEALWEADGRLKSVRRMDRIMLALHRDVWRDQVGLPKGAAEGVPYPVPSPPAGEGGSRRETDEGSR